MAALSRIDHKPRSTRFQGRPDRHNNFVRFAAEIKDAEDYAAQYADVSLSGMRLISRNPAKTHVGDVMSVEFTLPGTPAPVRNLARVVRKVSDYEFAVRFVHDSSSDFEKVLHEHRIFLENERLESVKTNITNWLGEHKKALLLTVLALALASSASAYIYMVSNQRVGVVKSWGGSMQNEWFSDYYSAKPGGR